jgi:hypothetical protein
MILLRPISATVLALACVGALAQGASAPASGAAGGGKAALVQRVLALQQGAADAVALGFARQTVAAMNVQLQEIVRNRVPADQRDAVARDIQAEFKKYGDEVVPMLREHAQKLLAPAVAPVLEQQFSEDELKQVVAMLEAPIYRKYQQVAPEMERALLDKLVPETRSLVEPKFKALQDAVGKRLQAASKQAQSGASAPRSSASAPRAAASGTRK